MKKTLKTLFTAGLIIATSLFGFTQNLPNGFSIQTIAELRSPTCLTALPDGSILVGEQEGDIKLFKNGKLEAQPVLTISDVKYIGEKGLIGMVAHPQFASNKYVYVFYTKTQPGFNYDLVIDRFTLNGDKGENQIQILNIGRVSSRWYDIWNHNGGGMAFGNDGKLYIGVGYNDQDSQTLQTTPFGKVIRINDDGSSPSDNPYFEEGGNASTNRIYITGMRNPFSLSFIKNTKNSMILADVGSSAPGGREEINLIIEGGKHLGFPYQEGVANDPQYLDPLYFYQSKDQLSSTVEIIDGCAVTGSLAFYPNTSNYPEQYKNKVYFMDFCNGWLSYLSIDENGKATRSPFASGLGKLGKGSGHIALTEGSDGNIYFLTRLSRTIDPSGAIATDAKGALKRIVYETNIAVDKNNSTLLNFNLDPNPANDVVAVNLISDLQNTCEVTFIDMMSIERLSMSFNTSVGENEQDIDISGLAKGTYLVKVKNGLKFFHKKLVVE